MSDAPPSGALARAIHGRVFGSHRRMAAALNEVVSDDEGEDGGAGE